MALGLLILPLISTTATAAENAKPKVVFTDLVAQAPFEATRDAIASEVRASFVATELFQVVPNDTVRKMVAVSPSAACSQVRCAARLGRLVEADYVVVGEVVGHGDAVAVALRVVKVDGSITHRMGFDVRTKREELSRDVDGGVRSMLGLGVRKQSNDKVRVEVAANQVVITPAMPTDFHQAPRTVQSRDFSGWSATDIEVWHARFEALN
jgi:TolB-like protein